MLCIAVLNIVVMYRRMVFSSTLVNMERSEIGLYEVYVLLFLFGFRISMILANFHIYGRVGVKIMCVWL